MSDFNEISKLFQHTILKNVEKDWNHMYMFSTVFEQLINDVSLKLLL